MLLLDAGVDIIEGEELRGQRLKTLRQIFDKPERATNEGSGSMGRFE